jgi:hypothetical protein
VETLNDLLKSVPVIEESKNYWFFRTMGGRLFLPFFDKSFIALNYSKINENKVNYLIDGEINETKIKFVRDIYPDNHRPGLIISNLKRFYREMKVGDYILIPDKAGTNSVIGEIAGNVEKIEGIARIKHGGKIYIDREYRRSRKVLWKSISKRSNFSPELYRLLSTHQTISQANSYSEWIDAMLYNFYKKGNRYHYIINVGQRYGLSAKTVYGFFSELLDVTDEFLQSENISENTNSLDTKIVLTSPGFVEFLGNTGTVLAAIALIVFFNGGGFKIKTKGGVEVNFSSEGIIKRLNEFLNSKQDRKTKESLLAKIKDLEIKNVEDVVRILAEANKSNQNEKTN